MNRTVESYLHYIQKPKPVFLSLNESEMMEYISEAFFKLDKKKIKSDIDYNTKKLNSFLMEKGIDIKKATKSDATRVFNLIKKGFESKSKPEHIAKKVVLECIEIIKRLWKPSDEASFGEKVSGSILIGLISIFIVCLFNTYVNVIIDKILDKIATGPLAAMGLFLRWLISGALSEEVMKRFFLKKFGAKGGVALTAMFGFVEAILYKLQKGEPLIQGIIVRVLVHSYTAFIQALGIQLDKKFKTSGTFEYIAFFLMVAFHASLNMRNIFDKFIPLAQGKLRLRR